MSAEAPVPAAGAGADLGYLFVVTYGRSGSTLLSGLLNSIPGYLIRGENGDALRHLWHYSTTLLTERERRSGTRARTHPFFGIGDVPPRKLREGTRQLALDTVLRPKEGTRVVGFKEIRWWREDVADYVAWLREVFPGARFVVNTRDHAGVLASGWWAAEGDEQKAAHNARHLADIEERLLGLARDLGPAAHHVHFDDYVADPGALRPLHDWLGEPFDEAAVREVMARRHSVGVKGSSPAPGITP